MDTLIVGVLPLPAVADVQRRSAIAEERALQRFTQTPPNREIKNGN